LQLVAHFSPGVQVSEERILGVRSTREKDR